MPDIGTYGANDRFSPGTEPGVSNAQGAENMILAWWTNWITAMGIEIPEKFHMAGFGNGAYQVGLYASRNPEKINKLLLLSPANFCPKNYNFGSTVHPYASILGKPMIEVCASFKT